MAVLLACGGGGDAVTTSPLVWAMDVTTGDGYDGPTLTTSDAVSRALVNEGCAPSVTQCVTFDITAPGFRHKISIPSESLVPGDSYGLDSPRVVSEISGGSGATASLYKADTGLLTIGPKVGDKIEISLSGADHFRASRGGGPYASVNGMMAVKWTGSVAMFETPFDTDSGQNGNGSNAIRGPYNIEYAGWEGGPGKPESRIYFGVYSAGSQIARISYRFYNNYGFWRIVPAAMTPPDDVLWQQPWPNPNRVWRGQSGSRYAVYAPTGTQTVGKVNMGGQNSGVTLAPDLAVIGNTANGTFKMWGVLAK